MDYCVYAHLTLDSQEIFYVGKGRPSRPHSKHNRNKHWHRIVQKHGLAVKLIAEGLSEDAAFGLEQELIKAYKAEGLCVANHVDGGRGVPGLVLSEASKNKMRDSLKIRNSNPTQAMLEGRKKVSAAKKAAWAAPSDAMLAGIEKARHKRRGRSKTTHAGVARMAEKIKLKSAGASNPNHRWRWITPGGDFFSSYEASRTLGVGRKTIERRCKKNTNGWSREEV